MNLLFTNMIIFAAFGIYSICNAQEVKEEKDVLVLTTDNFDSVVTERDTTLVEFYAPWCGHCKSLEPIYAEAAKLLKSRGVSVAKVDATVETKLAEKYGIQAYPTLKMFKKALPGDVFDYKGPRSADGIASYMVNIAKPDWKPPEVLKGFLRLSSDNFTEFIPKQPFWVVAFVKPGEAASDAMSTECQTLAQQYSTLDPPMAVAFVDMTADSELAAKYTSKSTILGFNKISEPPVKYYHEVSAENLRKFVSANQGDILTKVKTIDDKFKVLEANSGSGNFFLGVFDDKSSDDARFFAQFLVEHGHFYPQTLEGGFASPAIADIFKLKSNGIYLHKAPKLLFPGETGVLKYDGPTEDFASLRQWISANILPTVGHYTWNTKDYYDDSYPICLFFMTVDFVGELSSSTQMWRQKVADIARTPKFSGVRFALADDQEDQELIKGFRLEENSGDFSIGCFDSNGYKYSLSDLDGFEKDTIMDFLNKFMAGSLKPVLRSATAPNKNEGLVKILTGDTFMPLVHQDTTKNSVVLLCSSERHECKSALNELESVAKMSEVAPFKIMFGFLNTALNDAPGKYRVVKDRKKRDSDVPVVYLSLASNKKDPIRFTQTEISRDALFNFLKNKISVLKEEL